MGKYETLGRHLNDLSVNFIDYNISEIEDILGFPLPSSASIYRPWWANDKTHVQARDGWMKYGWNVDTIDFSTNIVRFKKIMDTRIENTERNYINLSEELSPSQFEEKARIIMSKHFSQELYPQKIENVHKLFDLVSEDRSIVGDAKYLTMVRGTSIPPAKFATIAEYVWLLEKTNAKNKFLVFGKDKRVPEEWLKRYGNLVSGVDFYFIDSNSKLEKIEWR
jgi:hypothetical protein